MIEQPVSLYIGLVEGQKADLATAARAALAFDAAIKEIAFFIDPSISISVVLESGTEGSLHLNSVIRILQNRIPDRNTLKMIAYGAVGWFAAETASHVYDRMLSTIYAEEDSISDEDAEKIAAEVVRMINGGIAQEEVAQVYEELAKDEKVTEAGATTVPEKRPEHPVPRSQFMTATRLTTLEETSTTRWTEKEETVILVGPILLASHRKWKFSFHEGEFGAPILDDEFLERLLTGREPVPMTAGISMRVILRTKLERIQNAWAVRERQITKVLAVIPAFQQPPLEL